MSDRQRNLFGLGVTPYLDFDRDSADGVPVTDRRPLMGFSAGLAGLCLGVLTIVLDAPVLAIGSGISSFVAGMLVLQLARDTTRSHTRIAELDQRVHELERPAPDTDQPDSAVPPPVNKMDATARRRDSVPDEALTDTTTGLFSEDYFMVAIDARISAARRHLRPVAVVLIDVVEGLGASSPRQANPVAVAESIMQTLRDADTACRLSDGRFALVLEDTPENGAIWTVERIRRRLTDKQSDLTLWAGVACYPAHAFETQDILRGADAALVSAREWRQDRIEVAVLD